MTSLQRFFRSARPAFLALGFVLLLTSLGFAADDYGTIGAAFDRESTGMLNRFACSMRSTGGWIMIGIGMLLAAYDYFIQKQGQILVAAVVGTMFVIILSRILPTGGLC